jgi:hypothetical protein
MSARVKLVAFVAVMLTAGVLPWATDGSAAAKGLASPFLLLGLIGAAVTVRLWRPAPAASAPAQFECCGGCAAASAACADRCPVPTQRAG